MVSQAESFATFFNCVEALVEIVIPGFDETIRVWNILLGGILIRDDHELGAIVLRF